MGACIKKISGVKKIGNVKMKKNWIYQKVWTNSIFVKRQHMFQNVKSS